MGNPTPNAFVSAYKNYWVKKSADSGKWEVLTRGTHDNMGSIQLHPNFSGVNTWYFYPAENIVFTQIQLLDIAAAVKTIEKRADTPSIFKP